MVNDETIQSYLETSDSLEETVQKLIDTANEQGGVDNITVLLIDLGGAIK